MTAELCRQLQVPTALTERRQRDGQSRHSHRARAWD